MLVRSVRKNLPVTGAVGGIDVGWSQMRASSAVARLEWDAVSVRLGYKRFRAVDPERTDTIVGVLDRTVIAVALDGPLCTGLLGGSNYRFAERMLTAGFQPLIGKPGQTSSPNGQKLNEHATISAKLVIGHGLVATADHPEKIHSLSVVEAFPTSFLGILIQRPYGLKSKRKASSDVFFEELDRAGVLIDLLARLLPHRRINFRFSDIRNHDDRAAVVCALTALCIAAGDYTAVGDDQGWIILPPFDCVQPWAHELFAHNKTETEKRGIRPVNGIKLGMQSGIYPSMSLEDFNSGDDEIAELFLSPEARSAL